MVLPILSHTSVEIVPVDEELLDGDVYCNLFNQSERNCYIIFKNLWLATLFIYTRISWLTTIQKRTLVGIMSDTRNKIKDISNKTKICSKRFIPSSIKNSFHRIHLNVIPHRSKLWYVPNFVKLDFRRSLMAIFVKCF